MLLRPMTADEFAVYQLLFIDEYANDLAASRNYSPEEALQRASESIDFSLPKGVETAMNRLWCLALSASDDPPVGYLWLAMTGQSAWIYDFFIYPEWRGKGYGHAALENLSHQLALEGVAEIGLRVAPINAAAKHLYEKLGFSITGINMSKRLAR